MNLQTLALFFVRCPVLTTFPHEGTGSLLQVRTVTGVVRTGVEQKEREQELLEAKCIVMFIPEAEYIVTLILENLASLNI